MTDENLKTFAEIVEACEQGHCNSINVASKKRSAAIVAVWSELCRLRRKVNRLEYQSQLLHDKNRQLQDTIDANEERERLLKARAATYAGRAFDDFL